MGVFGLIISFSDMNVSPVSYNNDSLLLRHLSPLRFDCKVPFDPPRKCELFPKRASQVMPIDYTVMGLKNKKLQKWLVHRFILKKITKGMQCVGVHDVKKTFPVYKDCILVLAAKSQKTLIYAFSLSQWHYFISVK